MIRVCAGFFLVFGPLLVAGCQPSSHVGRCDDPELSRTLVYSETDGYPAFAGQALVEVSCANGAFCHSAGVEGKNRLGAPHGLDFDVTGSRAEEGVDEEAVRRLIEGREKVFDWREEVLGAVVSGWMPPGDAGDDVVQGSPTYLYADGTPLPAVGSEEGERILENWLECGPPAVASITELPDELAEAGDVVDAMPPQVVEPVWSDIYEKIIADKCVSCHGPGPASQIEPSGLDLSEEDLAYDEMVGVAAEGDECAPDGDVLVEAGDPDASLLVAKLEGTSTCGDPMPPPPLTLLPARQVDVIRQWIADGAMND